MQRSKKTISLIYLACGFIAYLILRELVLTVWTATGYAMPADWIVPPSDMIGAALGFVVFITLYTNTKVVEFTNEVITELGRVVWPSKKETVLSTGVVSVLVAVCALLFFLVDTFWASVVKIFYS